MRTRNDLLEIAGRYARERRVPLVVILKEILHYEILFALGQSGATSALTFQGGTALRLCYQGTRYSEDLDFAGGADFDPATMSPFADLLQHEIADAYGLHVDIQPPRGREAADGINVARWRAKVRIPQPDPSIPQHQVINIEVASVPAHDRDLVAVGANYPHLPAPLRQMLIVAETRREILSDKLVALGARPFVKYRDIWDIKFLTDQGIAPDFGLVGQKLIDYEWTETEFKDRLSTRLADLLSEEHAAAFTNEMHRFVDAPAARHLSDPTMAQVYLKRAHGIGIQTVNAHLQPRA